MQGKVTVEEARKAIHLVDSKVVYVVYVVYLVYLMWLFIP